MARDWEQVTGQSAPGARRERPPRMRRLIRRGPRIQATRNRAPRAADGAPAQATAPAAPALSEWHDLTPGEQTAAWASLRAWVTWLYDRYELAVEDRLPRCWASHPGLVEELAALKAWREEIYASGQPSGQAARYWHSEMRQVLHAAATQYALGCRTGHRGATALAADQPGPAELLGCRRPHGQDPRHRHRRRHRPPRRPPRHSHRDRHRARQRRRDQPARQARHHPLPGCLVGPRIRRLD